MFGIFHILYDDSPQARAPAAYPGLNPWTAAMPAYAPAAYGNFASNPLSYGSGMSTPAEAKPTFPPPFETHGGAYVFQAQSGCFFEPSTAFYYCPKSKLYYNSHEGTYFRYSPGADPPYISFEPPLPFDKEEPVVATVDLEAPRKPVSLSLGPKSSKPKVPVKLTQDISKWQERQKELAEAAPEKKTDEEVPELKIPVFNSDKAEEKDGKEKVIACLLCRRQFKTTEQLARHEKESKLHADNLAKKAAEEVKYRDRASERRALHGSSNVPILDMQVERPPTIGVEFFPVNPMVLQAQPASSAVPISEGNTGNALLRKMGWDGDGLGKDNQGISVPVGLEEPKQDKGGLGSKNAAHSSWEYATTEDYRKSVRDAARARFNDFQQ